MTAGNGRQVGAPCAKPLDPTGHHAANCLVGGRRKHTHNVQRDQLGSQLAGAGYAVHREQHVPGWDRWKRLPNGRWELEHAILDLRLEAPPDAPLTYVDVKVVHPCSGSYVAGAATANGFAAALAEERNHSRSPPTPEVRGRLVPFAVETYGRLGDEGLSFLRRAAGRACTRTTALAVLGGEGPPAALGAWLQRQSVALQKSNAAAFRAAAGATSRWQEHSCPGLEEMALDLLASAEHLAAVAA